VIDCRPVRLRSRESTESPDGSSTDRARERITPNEGCVRRSRVSAEGLRAAAREAALVAFALLAYFGVRVLVRDQGPQAVANAAAVLRLESALGLARELPLQQALLHHLHLVRLLNWVYTWGYWPVLAASLCCLYVWRRQVYRRLRSALVISGIIGLLIFMSFPVAPPRLAATGLVDTIMRYDPSYEEVAHPSRLTNQNAAMPSFHFGWELLCGVCLGMSTRRRDLRALFLGIPLIMAAAIVVTGNHYILDGVVGGALALLGLAFGDLGQRLRPRRAADGVQGA
jgi:hypothetical protein